MNKTALRFGGFVASAGVAAALVGMAASGTGAYFSDTKNASVSGTMGTIKVNGVGGDQNLNVSFRDMLPGEASTKTVEFQNTGSREQDVWVVFNDSAKLHALNQFGTYGEVHLSAGGTELFGSKNLNDGFSCGTPGEGDKPTLCALPAQIKIADNLGSGDQGSFTFSFTPGAAFKNVQGAQLLDLPYQLVATQHGITPAGVKA